MFSSMDVEWDERTELSEWECHLKGDVWYIGLTRSYSEVKDVIWEAWVFTTNPEDKSEPFKMDMGPVNSKTPIAVAQHYVEYMLRKQYVERFLKGLTPEEFDMFVNVVDMIVDRDFNLHTTDSTTTE